MSLETLYDGYYASDRELKWYEISAVDKAKNVLDFCTPLEPRRLLDIGAGNGAVTGRLLEAGLAREIDAVEVSESGLSELHRRLGSRIHGIQKSDGLNLPYADDAFDLAILSHVLEHLEHPRLMLYEARRVASHLYVEVPLEDVAFKRNLHGDFVMDTTGHINYYNRHTIKRLLQTSGWEVLRKEVRLGSSEPYRFQKGRRGLIEYAVKRAARAMFPQLSQHFFVFDACMLCKRSARLSTSLGGP